MDCQLIMFYVFCGIDCSSVNRFDMEVCKKGVGLATVTSADGGLIIRVIESP
jgi:hypothetical protein